MIAVQNSAPSTLIDVIAQIRDAFQLMGDATPIDVGAKFLQPGAGSAPRIVFVPERTGGKIEAGTEIGMAASVVHACTVYVRGAESGEDFDRFKEAYRIGDRVISCIKTACSGRVTWTAYGDGSPVDVDAFGAELVFGFLYRRDVPHDAARWALQPADADKSLPLAQPPPGKQAPPIVIDPTVTTVGATS